MTAAHTDEKVVNGALARELDTRHPRWSVVAEQTKLLATSPSKKLDVLIKPQGAGLLPLPLETEFDPARTVEQDAIDRLGERMAASNTSVVRAIAVRLPKPLQTLSGQALADAVTDAATTYEWCVVSRSDAESTDVTRWPEEGYLTGCVDELSRFCELLLVDDDGLLEAALELETTVNALTETLYGDDLDEQMLLNAASVLRQVENEQTTKMALTLMANAFIFERAIQGTVDPNTGKVLPVSRATDTQAKVLANWQEIIDYNYWPIFRIASDVLGSAIRTTTAGSTVIPQLVNLADNLSQYGVTATGDISGQLFGRLITDRKYLATFYTLPSSAYLMTEMVAAKLDAAKQTPTGAGKKLESFKVADLACGTGSLLTSLYQRIAARIRTAGNDDAVTHTTFMEHVIHAQDIMPAAAHLTATLLASTHPTETFADTRVVLAEYGALSVSGATVDSRTVRVGALDLMDDTHVQSNLLDPTPAPMTATVVTGTGSVQTVHKLEHGSLDACVMNPPFTSDSSDALTNRQPTRMFAAFDLPPATQNAMRTRLNYLADKRADHISKDIKAGHSPKGLQPAHHGNLGLAPDFIDLADAKLKAGGVLGLILPQAFLSGKRWQSARDLIQARYDDIVVLTIAATGQYERAFSADTGMAECMLVARRARRGGGGNQKVIHVALHRRPDTLVEGVEMARSISRLPSGERTGDVPMGGSDACGVFVRANAILESAAAVGDVALLDTAAQLTSGVLRLPRVASTRIPMTTIGTVGVVGPNDLLIGQLSTSKNQEGPLNVRLTKSRTSWTTSDYPTLWSHDAQHETQLEVLPDGAGTAKYARESDADVLWAKWAARLHLNRDFQLNSQPLAACRTPEESLGGRAWPALVLSETAWESAVTLWHNCTLGLLAWWWRAGRQQKGRAILTVSQLPGLPTLDYRLLTDDQLKKADEIYDRFTSGDTKLTLRPANEAWHDEARHQLDRAVLEEVLGLDWSAIEGPLSTLRHQWCSEPTVHGGQLSRPDSVGGNISLVRARERLTSYAENVTSRTRQKSWQTLSGRRTKNPAAMKHYLLALKEIASLSDTQASELASDVAEVLEHDIRLARARAEEARAAADSVADDDERSAEEERRQITRWEHVVMNLEDLHGRLPDF